MYISSDEVPFQKQLVMGGVTHKLIYMLKPLNFVNVGQTPLSYSNYQCGTNFLQLQHAPSRMSY